ncbi:MAG: methyltransferase domain-containing protein [Acidobacteriota bacterium]
MDTTSLDIFKFKIRRFFAMRGMNAPLLKSGLPPDYWQRQQVNSEHGPDKYLEADSITRTVLDEFITNMDRSASFIEIGCNAGRNLNYLYENGFCNLAGMDINETAIKEIMPANFPGLYQCGKFYIGNSAVEIKGIADESYDVVFSIAVLIHIPPDNISLFKDMVRISKRYIVVFTDENINYDFAKVFERLGCQLVYKRLYYGEDSIKNMKMPAEPYDEKKHSFDCKCHLVFIKGKG